jgi:hypothetical protein
MFSQAGALSACDKGHLSQEGQCTDEEPISVLQETVKPRAAIPEISCSPSSCQAGLGLWMPGSDPKSGISC